MLAGVGAMRECLYKQFAFLESVANLPFKVGRIRVFHVQFIEIPGLRLPASWMLLPGSQWKPV